MPQVLQAFSDAQLVDPSCMVILVQENRYDDGRLPRANRGIHGSCATMVNDGLAPWKKEAVRGLGHEEHAVLDVLSQLQLVRFTYSSLLGIALYKEYQNILFPVGCKSKYPYRCKSATQLYDKVAFQVLRVHTCPTCTDHAAEAGKVQGTGTEQSHVLGREDLHGP